MSSINWLDFFNQLISDNSYLNWRVPGDIHVGIKTSIERADLAMLYHYFSIGIYVYSCPPVTTLMRWQAFAEDTRVPLSFLD